MKSTRRKIKLIDPAFQLRVVAVFAGLSVLSFLLQGLFITSRMNERSLALAGQESASPSIWVELFVLSIGLFLPLTIGVGIVLTHRIAGPAYRMEQHLRAILRGEELGICKLRKGDELQGLCDVMNQTITHLQKKPVTPAEETAEELRDKFRAVS
ncbi:MAG: hypothetical protein ACI8QS_001984 [Planctomycetota bacterium]|jgi:hypothetical protein